MIVEHFLRTASKTVQGISALDLQKHMFPSDNSPMNSTFPWMQRHDVSYFKGEQKGKVKTHNYMNRQNQSTTGKL
jgi:hypothetical protein